MERRQLGRGRPPLRGSLLLSESRALLDLTPDEVLSTTRAVRRRLDLERPVEREVLEDCLRLAQQAPAAGYREDWHFVVVTDPKSARHWASSGAGSVSATWEGGPRPTWSYRTERGGCSTPSGT